MKIAIVSCYAYSDYVRTRVLRQALQDNPDIETIVIKNLKKGILRYPEVLWKVVRCKLRQRPDAFILTFRGYEILPLMAVLKGRKPLIFDELVNAAEWLEEHGKLRRRSTAGKIFLVFYSWLLRRCRYVIADTQAHADFSAKICHIDIRRFVAIPVGTDEKVFKPSAAKRQQRSAGEIFEVFYYGSDRMLPLHGWEHVFEAAVELAKVSPKVHFTLVGGKEDAKKAAAAAIARGANITYKSWIPFEDIPRSTTKADLCLGGPFGKTLQSQFVITGKTYQFLSVGAPVLIGENGVTTSVFIDKQNCLTVPPADSAAIVKVINWAAKNPKKMRQIAKAGHETYTRNFSQKVITTQLAQLLKTL
jgi:glycosyltransferase involved in cell wall biosynthesis